MVHILFAAGPCQHGELHGQRLEVIAYAPGAGLNLESLNYVDAKVKPYLPTQYVDKQFWISDEWYAENGNKAIELWNAWMLKK